MKFVKRCPSCMASDKIIKPCKSCGKLICSECMINGICIDCHIETSPEEELYNFDKYRHLTHVKAIRQRATRPRLEYTGDIS